MASPLSWIIFATKRIEQSIAILAADHHLIRKRKNEDRFKADWVDATVDWLIGAGIDRHTVSTFSQALATLECGSSSCLRLQTIVGCLAKDVHVFRGERRYRMPTTGKKFITLARRKYDASTISSEKRRGV